MAKDEIAKTVSKAMAEAMIPEGTGKLDNLPWILDELEHAENSLANWKERVEELKEIIRRVGGEYDEITLNGKVQFTNARIQQFRGADFKKDHPDIYKAYSDIVEREVLNTTLLAVAQPDLYAKYQTRTLRKA